MIKKYYKIIKAELQKRRENVKYFNMDFFKMYIDAIKAGKAAEDAGTLEKEKYKNGLITLFHYFDPIYTSDFYTKNSGCYCEFLAVVNEYRTRLIEL